MPPSALQAEWLGRVPYDAALALQRDRVQAVAAREAPEALLLLEHEPVVTLGRKRGAEANVLAPEGPVLQVERGGDATWHGPGQLVAYVLLRLEGPERDLHAHLRRMEGWAIAALGHFGLEGRREAGATGVWVGAQKLVSLGIAVKRWTTYHGLALNVAPDMAGFQGLRPCGLEASVMGHMAGLLGGEDPGLLRVAAALLHEAPEAFGRPLAHWPEAIPPFAPPPR